MSDSTQIITNFKNSKEKVGRLNQQTAALLTKTLEEKRAFYFPKLKKHIPGRKIKILSVLVLALFFKSHNELSYLTTYKKCLQYKIISDQKKNMLAPFQMLEDRLYNRVMKREDAIQAHTLPKSKHYDAIMKLKNPFLTDDSAPVFQHNYLISHTGNLPSYKPISKQFGARQNKSYYNLSI